MFAINLFISECFSHPVFEIWIVNRRMNGTKSRFNDVLKQSEWVHLLIENEKKTEMGQMLEIVDFNMNRPIEYGMLLAKRFVNSLDSICLLVKSIIIYFIFICCLYCWIVILWIDVQGLFQLLSVSKKISFCAADGKRRRMRMVLRHHKHVLAILRSVNRMKRACSKCKPKDESQLSKALERIEVRSSGFRFGFCVMWNDLFFQFKLFILVPQSFYASLCVHQSSILTYSIRIETNCADQNRNTNRARPLIELQPMLSPTSHHIDTVEHNQNGCLRPSVENL